MIKYEFIHKPIYDDPHGWHQQLNEKVEEAIKAQINDKLAPVSSLIDQYDVIVKYNAIDKTSSIETSNMPDEIKQRVLEILKQA